MPTLYSSPEPITYNTLESRVNCVGSLMFTIDQIEMRTVFQSRKAEMLPKDISATKFTENLQATVTG